MHIRSDKLSAMSFFVAIAIGVVQTITAVVGSYVAAKKFTYKQKRPFFWIFIHWSRDSRLGHDYPASGHDQGK